MKGALVAVSHDVLPLRSEDSAIQSQGIPTYISNTHLEKHIIKNVLPAVFKSP